MPFRYSHENLLHPSHHIFAVDIISWPLSLSEDLIRSDSAYHGEEEAASLHRSVQKVMAKQVMDEIIN